MNKNNPLYEIGISWYENYFFPDEAYVSKEISQTQFAHQGIIINIADFPGKVQMSSCDVRDNMIYIPDIYVSNYSTNNDFFIATYSLGSTYAFKKCEDNVYEYIYNSMNYEVDLEENYYG